MMEKDKWKKIAILLGIVLILETVGISLLLSLGVEQVRLEDYCAEEICDDEIYEGYWFEYPDECSCFIDQEVVKTQKITKEDYKT